LDGFRDIFEKKKPNIFCHRDHREHRGKETNISVPSVISVAKISSSLCGSAVPPSDMFNTDDTVL
jgi:hypothetical protein